MENIRGENLKKFRIEYEVIGIEYSEDEFEDDGHEKILPVVYLRLSCLTILGDTKSRIFNSKDFYPAYLELCLSVEVFNSFTGLEWDGSKAWVENIKVILMGTKFELDLGIEKALENKIIEENKIVVKFPENFESYNAIDFCGQYVISRSIFFNEDVYDKYYIIILLTPINYKDRIIEIINQEGVYLEITAMTYKEYTEKNNK